MELQKQVTSLELSRKLKELGVKQECLYRWIKGYGNEEDRIWQVKARPANGINAYTVAELGEMLPHHADMWHDDFYDSKYGIQYRNDAKDCVVYLWDYRVNDCYHFESADTEANARAKMLIHLIENKLITI